MTNEEVIERLGYIKQQYNILLGTDIYMMKLLILLSKHSKIMQDRKVHGSLLARDCQLIGIGI